MKKDIKTNGWHAFVNPPAMTVNTRDVGGVLCRWWGDGPAPAGVAMIDAAALPTAPSEGQAIPTDLSKRLREGFGTVMLYEDRVKLMRAAADEIDRLTALAKKGQP